MKIYKTGLPLLISLLAIFMFQGCGKKSANDSGNMLTVSIAPQKYIVEQVAGDKWEVKALLTKGANPESYEPSMSHLIDLEKSRAYLRMGNLGFEDAIIGKVTATKPDLEVYNLSEGIELIEGTHCDGEDGHHHDHEVDPHTWSSVNNARVIALNTLNVLKKLDPTNSDYYTSNYNTFMTRLDSIDASIRGAIKASGVKRFVVWHPSLSYFARDYGLEQISVGSENKELSVPQLRKKIEAARGDGGRVVVLMQRDFDSRQAETLTRELDATIKNIDPLNPDWESEMTSTAAAIAGH